MLPLHGQIAELAQAIQDLLKADTDGHRLQQILGIGPNGATTIRAVLGEIARFSGVDEVVAYAGLDLRTHESGAYVGQKHLAQRGPGALRHALSCSHGEQEVGPTRLPKYQ